MKNCMHSIEEMPEGKTLGDINPAFSNLIGEIRVGKRSACCAGCRKPFTPVRKPRKEIRLWPIELNVPIAFAYPICGACVALYQRGEAARDSLFAAVESFHNGDAATQ